MTLVFDRMQIMDWIRRNFPDLLIGLALVVVIGAIIATLLSGGSLFPGGKRNTVADILPSSGSSTTLPVTSTATSINTGSIAVPVTTDTNTIDTNITTTIPQAPIATATGAATNAANSAAAAANALMDVTPLNPSALPVVVVSGNNETSNTTNTAAVSNTVVNTNTSRTVATASGNNAPYRVSVGAFGNAANANKRVETFKARGYPAFSAKQGSLTLVLVGPYDTQSQANKVAQDIKSSGLEPAANVIKFNPNAALSSSSSTVNTAPAVSTSTSATTSTSSYNALTAPPVAVSGNYLQVGAYRTNATAQPLKDKLAKLGFSPQNLEDNNFIKVIIGPFDVNGLKTAQAILKANNLDSFVR